MYRVRMSARHKAIAVCRRGWVGASTRYVGCRCGVWHVPRHGTCAPAPRTTRRSNKMPKALNSEGKGQQRPRPERPNRVTFAPRNAVPFQVKVPTSQWALFRSAAL
jgi:hypothetical protein